MIIIDGSKKEGGGQIFRTSLTLSLLTGKAVHITNIRAKRRKTGLLRQHLACLKAAMSISSASVTGDYLGSNEVTFAPGDIQSGDYEFSVGSAGSTTLIFQTVFLPLALKTNQASTIVFNGGTHNPLAPSYDFIEKSFLPLMKKIGLNVETSLKLHGFYPMGGGSWTAKIHPFEKTAPYLTLTNYDNPKVIEAISTSAHIEKSVMKRELDQVKKRLRLEEENLKQNLVESSGPGNILSIELELGDHKLLFETIGTKNKSSEKVANITVDNLNECIKRKATACEYLSDQLILPLVMTNGGKFIPSVMSLHFETQVDTIDLFYPDLIVIDKMQQRVFVKCMELL